MKKPKLRHIDDWKAPYTWAEKLCFVMISTLLFGFLWLVVATVFSFGPSY